MEERFIFCPIDSKSKSPVGAVKVNQENKFNLLIKSDIKVEEVYLVLTKDLEDSVWYMMQHKGKYGQADTLINNEVVVTDAKQYSSEDILQVNPDSFSTVCEECWASDDIVCTCNTNADNVVLEHDSYLCNITVTSPGLYFYYFVVITDNDRFKLGCSDDLTCQEGQNRDWQLTVFEQKYEPIEWLNGGLIYQVLPDRFDDGGSRLKTKQDRQNRPVVYRDDWGGMPEYKPTEEGKILNNDFFGGNLKGIAKRLTYLKNLGVTCIYLNPIFEAYSNHKYDTGNYKKVDSDFGTLKDLTDLIQKANKKGMHIVLDGVFSHTGDDSIYFNKYNNYDSVGAYQSENSPYSSWYKFKKFPKDYESWWGIDVLPNTKEEDIYFNEYINGIDGVIDYWTNQGISGWRLDVVDELPDQFLDRLVKSAKRARPDAMVLGEVWEDASNKSAYSVRRRYFSSNQLDSVTNYPFKECIIKFVKYGDSRSLINTVKVLLNNYPKHILHNVMNLVGTHDTKRIFTELAEHDSIETREDRASAKALNPKDVEKKLRLVTILQYTLVGVPCVYYGDESGMQGFEDPFNRQCFPKKAKERNATLTRWYKKLGKLRQDNSYILAKGNLEFYDLADKIIGFKRIQNGAELITIVNNSEKRLSVDFLKQSEYINILNNTVFNGKVKKHDGVILKHISDCLPQEIEKVDFSINDEK